jgi:hypothetical protein|tara:strand:+ start:578 stop:793 length:216 start_codon:yes stop_codon:yes gene_type:complete
MSVIKESFFEASFETKEEFESAEIAAKSDVSDNAELKVTEIKLEKSVIKTNQDKEQPNESEQHSKIVPEVK